MGERVQIVRWLPEVRAYRAHKVPRKLMKNTDCVHLLQLHTNLGARKFLDDKPG